MIGDQANIAGDYLFGVRSVHVLLLVAVKEYMYSGYTCYINERTLQDTVVSIDKRLQNVVDTHEEVMPLCIDEIFKRSFLHLQRLHIQSIALEIKMVFRGLESSTRITDTGVFNKIVESKVSIENLLVQTQDMIKAQATAFVLGTAPLTEKQLSICLSMYKYRSELITLHSYISQSIMNVPNHLDQVEKEIYLKGYNV